MASKTLTKRVAVEVEKLAAVNTDKSVKIFSFTPESREAGALLRERASAKRLNVEARNAVTEIARRKLNDARGL